MTEEDDKNINYSPLAKEIRNMHKMLMKIVLLVVGWRVFFLDFGIPGELEGMKASTVIKDYLNPPEGA